MDLHTANAGLGGLGNALEMQKLAIDLIARSVGQGGGEALAAPTQTAGQTTRVSAQAVTGVGGKLDVTV